MSKNRIQIPKKTEYELLFKNDMTCCICHNNNKGVVIHHIDNNPMNNSIDNLAVICQEHHDDIHKKGGLTKNLAPNLIKKYKEQWELYHNDRRRIKSSPLQSKSGIESVLFEFEIRKTTYEILSLTDDDVKEIKQKIDYLYSIHLLERYSAIILDSLTRIAILIAFENNKASFLAEEIHHYVWHLVGPDDVPITDIDKKNLFKILDILSHIGEFSANFKKNHTLIDSFLKSFNFIFGISINYGLEDYAKKLFSEIEKIYENCQTVSTEQIDFKESILKVKNYILKCKEIARDERPEWDWIK